MAFEASPSDASLRATWAEQVERACDQFERRWQGENPPVLEHFIPAGADPRLCHWLAVELVMIDLEYRWRRSAIVARRNAAERKAVGRRRKEPPHDLPTFPYIEDYCARWPQLGTADAVPVELIAVEYRVRSQSGDLPTHASFRARFPAQWPHLQEELARVDQQLVMARRPAPGRPPGEPQDAKVRRGKQHAERLGDRPAELIPAARSNGRAAYAHVLPGCRRYRILQALGSGTMADVFLAEDRKLRRLVAIKIPRDNIAADPKMLARFNREAKLVAFLKHPHICPLLDFGQDGSQFYLAMAYIEGPSLAECIEQLSRDHPGRTLRLMSTVARAVQHAHECGVVHRDLKPQNIIFNTDGEPIIVDFGLSRSLGTDSSRLTNTGDVLGTPAYMAPEQAIGASHLVDFAGDIYSAGIILFELLTGEQPFQGGVRQVIAQHVRTPPPAPSTLRSELGSDIDALCVTAMAKDPMARFPDMKTFADAIDHCLLGLPQSAGIAPTDDGQEPSGSIPLEIQFDDAPHSSEDGTTQLSHAVRLDLMNQRDGGRIVVVFGSFATLGRSRGCDFRLTGQDTRVSRSHALLKYNATDACYLIADEGSKHGTYLDGRRIDEPTRIAPGQELRLATEVTLHFSLSASPAFPYASLVLHGGANGEKLQFILAPLGRAKLAPDVTQDASPTCLLALSPDGKSIVQEHVTASEKAPSRGAATEVRRGDVLQICECHYVVKDIHPR